MKSTDVKNWPFESTYDETVNLDDFQALLADAVRTNCCLRCRGENAVFDEGVCFGCFQQLNDKEKEALEKVGKTYKVRVTVEKVA